MAKNKEQVRSINSNVRMNSFFTGIGGFDFAFEKRGIFPTFFCENNDFCSSVLKLRWPSVPNSGDITKLKVEDIPEGDIWTAGFPCQDLSLARTPHGFRSGLKGLQSRLFYTFLDLLAVQKPPIVILENVAGLLNSHNGADFKTIISSLTTLGYAVVWRVLNARYFGVPQSRPRIFICAWLGSPSKALNVLYENQVSPMPQNPRKGFIVESKSELSGISVPQLSFCISATSARHTGLDWARSYVTYSDSIRRLTPLECERLQGFPDNWTLLDSDHDSPDPRLDSNRYHAIGNAVCVPVAEWVADRIIKTLLLPKKPSIDKTSIKNHLIRLTGRLHSGDIHIKELSNAGEEFKWKSGGIAYEGFFVSLPVSSSPLSQKLSKFIDLLEQNEVSRRYFLSGNAIQGILRRVDKQGRTLFPPMDTVLRKLGGIVPLANHSNSKQQTSDLVIA